VILEAMQPVVVDLILLRAVQTGELRITPGRALMARVVQTQLGASTRGLISIAGELIEAELPRQVKPGDELRLVVRHVSADKVELSLSDPRAINPQAPPPAEVPLPGGGTLSVNDQESRGGTAGTADRETHTLSLRYEAPALGAVDLNFVLDNGALRLAVTLPGGQALALATQSADELRQTLGEQLHRTVEVSVSGRHEPLDVYA
jgi:hypothetical protein